MARKIFVSYKYNDSDVKTLDEVKNEETTARHYVDKLIEVIEGLEIYKGEEDGYDLSSFKDETIWTKLKEKIFDSSITIVLISKNMKEYEISESDQWIPMEISYSLKEITREDRTSHTNGVIAVVLPDKNNSYDYFLKVSYCNECKNNIRRLQTEKLFNILRKNMFNIKSPIYSNCNYHVDTFVGESSYIKSLTWDEFINDVENSLNICENINDNLNDYNLYKEVN